MKIIIRINDNISEQQGHVWYCLCKNGNMSNCAAENKDVAEGFNIEIKHDLYQFYWW